MFVRASVVSVLFHAFACVGGSITKINQLFPSSYWSLIKYIPSCCIFKTNINHVILFPTVLYSLLFQLLFLVDIVGFHSKVNKTDALAYFRSTYLIPLKVLPLLANKLALTSDSNYKYILNCGEYAENRIHQKVTLGIVCDISFFI